MRLRSNLVLLVIATALPLVVLAVLASYLLLTHEQANFVTAVKDRNRAFMSAVDAEIKGHVTSLQALTSLRSIVQGDLKAVHEDLIAAQRTQPGWLDVFLNAPDGRQLVNSLVPFGGPMPSAVDPVSFSRAASTGEPVIGGITDRPLVGKPGITVRVPVVQQNEVAYVLGAVIDPAAFEALIRQQNLPQGWISGLVDADGRFVARVPPRPPGTLAGDAYRAQVAVSDEGWFRGPTVEGRDTFSAFVRSSYTGWSVGFAIPAEVVLASTERTASVLGAVALLCIGLAILGAVRVGSRISAPIGELVDQIPTLGEGRPIEIRTGIHEVQQLATAMKTVSAAIAERHRVLELERKVLEESDHSKDEFLAMLSHELRNPLAALTNAATVLRLAPAGEDARKAQQVIERQTQQMARLVEDLLDVSRITLGKASLHFEPVELSALVQDALRTLQQGAKLVHHEIQTDLAPAWVSGDRSRLEQVVVNLLGNAIKFTPAGKRIRISVRDAAGVASIAVADAGIGIREDELGRVFDLFVQGPQDMSRARGGMGVGLSIVKRLVELHGGHVTAASAGPEKGSTFTVTLPATPAPATVTPLERAAPVASPHRFDVLVVEDNTDSRETLVTLLELKGHRVRGAADGRSALDSIARQKPDVALVDIGLPDVDGYTIARQVRKLPGMASVVLIALTGYGQPDDQAQAISAGFDLHLTKPITADHLDRVLSGFVARVRSTAGAQHAD
jgi:signal transduction histidine kinase/ActR/RegA family two-component response regulator